MFITPQKFSRPFTRSTRNIVQAGAHTINGFTNHTSTAEETFSGRLPRPHAGTADACTIIFMV